MFTCALVTPETDTAISATSAAKTLGAVYTRTRVARGEGEAVGAGGAELLLDGNAVAVLTALERVDRGGEPV